MLNTPLTAVSKDAAPYQSPDPWKPQGSPYHMEESSPHKYFISGKPKLSWNKKQEVFLMFISQLETWCGHSLELDCNFETTCNILVCVFIGFTGYVPKARFLIGTGYPIITNKALIQFGKEMKADQSSFRLLEETTGLPMISTIYPSKKGLLPAYTGHIPGICKKIRLLLHSRNDAVIIEQTSFWRK